MSTTGDPRVGGASEEALGVLLAPPAHDREEAIERSVAAFRVIGSPAYELDEAGLRERAGLSFDRAHDPAGVGRQLLAILASGDRTPRLRELARARRWSSTAAPTRSCGRDGGRATAAAIPGAELVVFDGMGHDLPRALWPAITERIVALVRRVEEGGGSESER